MSLENILLDTTVTIIDKDKQEKAGQIRYIIKDKEAEIFDTYMFPEYRRKKIISSLFRETIQELRVRGVSKVRLSYLNEDARIVWEKMGFKQTDREGQMELCI